MAATMATRLAPLIGLDEETVNQQILPHLESIKSDREVENYLLTLLAPGSQSRAFIKLYLDSRATTTTPTLSTRSSSAQSSRASTPTRNATQPRPPPPPQPPRPTSTNSKPHPHPQTTKANRVTQLEMSPEAKDELKRIDRALTSFGHSANTNTTKKKNKQTNNTPCFCSARRHALSSYAPLCRTCGLVLCTLNSPVSPCPSCGHSSFGRGEPLVANAVVEQHVADLRTRREALIERERVRQVERDREREAERRRIKFPELGTQLEPSSSIGGGGGFSGGGYAGHAGGGGGGVGGAGFHDRIARAYETGVSLNGRNFGAEKMAAATTGGGGGGKVLRLDGKGKVKVETKRKKPTKDRSNDVAATTRNEQEEEVLSEDDDGGDGLVAWIDPNDDGIRRGTNAGRSESDGGEVKTTRTFENGTIKRDDRPVWVEREELRHSIVDEDGAARAA